MISMHPSLIFSLFLRSQMLLSLPHFLIKRQNEATKSNTWGDHSARDFVYVIGVDI